MQVSVFQGDKLIGNANLIGLDLPMGCAMGTFVPSANYEQTEHAALIDGEDSGVRDQKLRVVSEAHGEIESQGFQIHDWPLLSELEFHAVGITRPKFDTLFGDYPDYRAYYCLDLSEEERRAKDQAVDASLRAMRLRGWLSFLAVLASVAVVVLWIF
jgi:hypothetical protein